MKDAFVTIFDFLKDKSHMLSTTVFGNSKILKYWIEKHILFHVCPKKQFSGAEFDPKTYKKKKKFLSDVFI